MTFFLVARMLSCGQAQPLEREADYVTLLNQHFEGELEVRVESGRVDILTQEFAIEVDYAPKWKQAIGQALWYGLQTNTQPGIILIKQKPAHNKYIIQLGSTLAQFGLAEQIKVWVYPDDFPQLK